MSGLKVGDIFRHPVKPEWGRGVVVELNGSKVQVFFENLSGKQALKLDTAKVKLERLENERAPLLEHLSFTNAGGAIVLDGRRVSFDALFKHFMDECPGGFGDERLFQEELRFKRAAHRAFHECFGDGRGAQLVAEGNAAALAKGFDAILSAQEILLAPKFERAPFSDAMSVSENALVFARGLFEYLSMPLSPEAFDRYVAALEAVRQTGRQRVTTWPLLTLFPFLAQPKTHMFLKPGVTKEAAQSIGVSLAYDAALTWSTYASLLKLCDVVDTELEKRGMKPEDHIETQSFLWVAVTYPSSVA